MASAITEKGGATMRLIDADALLDCIPYCDANCTSKISKVGAIADMVMLISEAPTIEAEPVVHGRWAEDLEDIICSECGCSWNLIDNCTETFNYCPNCGAKMDGG